MLRAMISALRTQVRGAAEPQFDTVHAAATAIVRALKRRCALETQLIACLLAGAVLARAVHVEAAKAVGARAASFFVPERWARAFL